MTGAMVSHRLIATDPGVQTGRVTPLPLYAVLLSRRPSGLRKTKHSTNSLAHRTTWLRSDLPNSVGSLRGDHLTGAMVSHRLIATDPGVQTGRVTPLPLYAVLLRTGFGEPMPSPAPLVSSYLTVSPLPAAAPNRAEARDRTPPVGGLLSVPLSVGSRLPGITRRPAQWSSDFPHDPASAAA